MRVLLNYDLSNKVKSVNKVFKLFGYEITRIILYGFVGLKIDKLESVSKRWKIND